jgi:hypothetical protein
MTDFDPQELGQSFKITGPIPKDIRQAYDLTQAAITAALERSMFDVVSQKPRPERVIWRWRLAKAWRALRGYNDYDDD